MRSIKLSSFAGSAVLLGALCSQAFAWSISGIVQDKNTGAPLAGVSVATFNYAGFATTSAADGSFSLNNEGTESLLASQPASMAATLENGIFTLSNVNAHQLKISVIDALGKVTYQRSFYEINGSVSINLAKATGHRAKFLRVSKDGSSQTYMMQGKSILLKEGEPLPMLNFAKEGYNSGFYQMKQETETNVVVKLSVNDGTFNSSSSVTKPSSSSSKAKSSSSKDNTPVDCTGKSYAAGDHNMSVNVNGKKRTFIMHVPDAYKGDKPVPMVVDYHPIGGSGAGQLSGTSYKNYTDAEGVISLYPDGTGKPGGMGNGWNVGPCCSDDDDIAFSREMIKAVEEKVCIDKKRVYAAGFSMGGGMSNHVACNMADIYAAVAPAAMDLNTENSASCNPDRPISVIMFRGTNDFVCSYNGGDSGHNDGLTFLGAEGNFKFWADKNGCTGSPTTNSDGCKEYSQCNDGVKVVLCVNKGIDGGAFAGPDGHAQGDAKIGWPFLKQFTLP